MSQPRLSARAVLPGHTSPPYVVLEQDGNEHIWRVKNGTPVRITESFPSFDERFDPRLSPDGTLIAYTQRTTGLYHTRCIGDDGTGDIQIHTSAGGGPGYGDGGPVSWAPDSSHVVFKHSYGALIRAYADGSGVSGILTVSNGQQPHYSHPGDFDAGIGGLYFQAILPPPNGVSGPAIHRLDFFSGGIPLVRSTKTIAGGFDYTVVPGDDSIVFGEGISGGVNGNWKSSNYDGTSVDTLNATTPAAVDQVISTYDCVMPVSGLPFGYAYAFRYVGPLYELYRYDLFTGSGPVEVALGHSTTGQIGLGPLVYEDRVWWMDRTPGKLWSCDQDGGDLTLEHDLSVDGVGDDFYLNTGFSSNRTA